MCTFPPGMCTFFRNFVRICWNFSSFVSCFCATFAAESSETALAQQSIQASLHSLNRSFAHIIHNRNYPMAKINVQNTEITIVSHNDDDYIS